MARTFAPLRPVLHRVLYGNQTVPKASKVYETHQNVSLEATGLDRVRSLRKIPTRLRGMNFCTRLAHFALSVVMQPNSPKCTKIVRSAPKYKVSIQWDGSNGLLWKISDTTSWPELLHHFTPFCTQFCKATKRYQMHQNSTKRTDTWGKGPMRWIGYVLAKNSVTTSWHKLLHHFGRFCTEFCTATKRSKMHPNSTKHTKTWV